MQWGLGLPAQHLDMDLSCQIAYETYEEICYFGNLTPTGCRHSGDIQHIPDQVGTAEYIELDLDVLISNGARFAVFTCNAYSQGEIVPNLVVGWMNSIYPMHISEKTGVAYDPSCVQHQVRITQGLNKGLVFGVLDLNKQEITWMELSFNGQVIQSLDVRGVKALLAKLTHRLNIGQLLMVKAEAQGLTLVETPDSADEIYTREWAINAAAVSQLFLD